MDHHRQARSPSSEGDFAQLYGFLVLRAMRALYMMSRALPGIAGSGTGKSVALVGRFRRDEPLPALEPVEHPGELAGELVDGDPAHFDMAGAGDQLQLHRRSATRVDADPVVIAIDRRGR